MILLQGLDIPIIWTDTIDHFILKSILPIVSILKKKKQKPNTAIFSGLGLWIFMIFKDEF